MTELATPQLAILPCAACGKLNRVDVARADARALCGSCKAPIALDAPVTLTDGNFDTIANGTALPIIVDFYAEWCGPCKMMAPIFADLGRRQRGHALVGKLDTDRNQNIAGRFQVRSIPTLVVLRNGKEVTRQVGAVPMAVLEQLLNAR
jgi:thioredoxin 2